MKEIIGKIICFFTRKHQYKVQETFKRIGTNEYHKFYICDRCGHVKHEVSTTINP